MIEIYSTPQCPWCKKAKAYFTEHKVPYTDYDVASDEKRAKELVEKSGQMGVPVINVNGTVIVGFDRVAIEAALKVKGAK